MRARQARTTPRARHHRVLAVVILPPATPGGPWWTRCDWHRHREDWPTRRVARIAADHPQDWCPGCAVTAPVLSGEPLWQCWARQWAEGVGEAEREMAAHGLPF